LVLFERQSKRTKKNLQFLGTIHLKGVDAIFYAFSSLVENKK